MKEQHFFYVPEPDSGELPQEEAAHALRVLRLREGCPLMLMDGKGNFYEAVLTKVKKNSANFNITAVLPQTKSWQGHIHLAMAPTKNLERTEWALEKMTEIGYDEFTPLICACSERRTLKKERLERIVTSAVKQSRKPWFPVIHDLQSFSDFMDIPFTPDLQRFICHCQTERLPELRHQMSGRTNVLVLVGPEGDFSSEEIALAESRGFRSVSLGRSRLRTETAALVATHLIHLNNS